MSNDFDTARARASVDKLARELARVIEASSREWDRHATTVALMSLARVAASLIVAVTNPSPGEPVAAGFVDTFTEELRFRRERRRVS